LRQSKWTIDEVILAVDVYFKIEDKKDITKNNPLIIELSHIYAICLYIIVTSVRIQYLGI